MARDWKIGEVVWLKSGGPAMTVAAESTKHDGLTSVAYFEPASNIGSSAALRPPYQVATFPKDALIDKDPEIQSIRKALSGDSVIRMPQLEEAQPQSIKVEPVTINWQGAAPSAEMMEQLISRLRATSQDLLEDSLAALYDHKSRADFALDELLKLSRRAVPLSREKIAMLRELWWPAGDVARPTEGLVELKTEQKFSESSKQVDFKSEAKDQPRLDRQEPKTDVRRTKPLT